MSTSIADTVKNAIEANRKQVEQAEIEKQKKWLYQEFEKSIIESAKKGSKFIYSNIWNNIPHSDTIWEQKTGEEQRYIMKALEQMGFKVRYYNHRFMQVIPSDEISDELKKLLELQDRLLKEYENELQKKSERIFNEIKDALEKGNFKAEGDYITVTISEYINDLTKINSMMKPLGLKVKGIISILGQVQVNITA